MSTLHTSPRRILFLSHVSSLGGGELSLLDLVASLNPARISCRVLLPGPGELARGLEELGVPWDSCPDLCRLHRPQGVRQFAQQAGSLVRVGLALRRQLRHHPPHLLHANSTTAALFALALPRHLPCPVIWHLRDLAVPSAVKSWLARRCTRVVVPSAACRRILGEVIPAKIEWIPNGIQISLALPSRPEPPLAPGAGSWVAVVGQLAPWKGHGLAIEVARRVRDRLPGTRFALLGDDRFGDHPCAADELRRRVRELGLEDTVFLLGHRKDVDSVLAASALLLHPAYPEPFGRVVVEALAVGCPVVAFAGDHGPAEIVRHGIDGLLVEPRSPQALATAVCDLLADHPRRQRLAAAGKERAATFNRKLMARRMEAVYASILEPLGVE
jgi:glycosyltransferase involved in cell wall biosynthesis